MDNRSATPFENFTPTLKVREIIERLSDVAGHEEESFREHYDTVVSPERDTSHTSGMSMYMYVFPKDRRQAFYAAKTHLDRMIHCDYVVDYRTAALVKSRNPSWRSLLDQ